VLASLFPDRTTELNGWVTEAGLSRMYAGIHYRFDITAGRNLGEAVGQWALAHTNLID
jgi:membrane-associated phospholipid phosphatase